jgi:hypothetical protein
MIPKVPKLPVFECVIQAAGKSNSFCYKLIQVKSGLNVDIAYLQTITHNHYFNFLIINTLQVNMCTVNNEVAATFATCLYLSHSV